MSNESKEVGREFKDFLSYIENNIVTTIQSTDDEMCDAVAEKIESMCPDDFLTYGELYGDQRFFEGYRAAAREMGSYMRQDFLHK